DGVLVMNRGPVLYPVVLVGLYFVTLTLVALIGQYRRLRDPLARSRTLYILVGVCCIVGFGVLNVDDELSSFSIDHIGNLLSSMLTTYAILKHRLLEIRLILRRTIALSFVTMLFAFLYLLVLSLFRPVLETEYSGVRNVFMALLIIAGVALLGPATNQAQSLVDRLFLGDHYLYLRRLASLQREVGESLDLDGIATSLLRLVTQAVGAGEASLLVPQSGGFSTRFATHVKGNAPVAVFELAAGSPIISYLAREGRPLFTGALDTVPEMKDMWHSELRALDVVGYELLCPLLSGGRLVGILALGAKERGEAYTVEELDSLMTAAREVGVLVDNARRHAVVQNQANTDELTGLLNHRLFYQTLEDQIHRGSRFGSSFSLLMIDIDHFKTYNDSYGHTAGDAILKEIAESIAGSVRHIDLAFRYGGEEFAVILPEAGGEDALKVAERIRRAVEARMDAKRVWLTISTGVANWPNDGVIGSELVRCADTALYAAKHRGRNTSFVYSRLSQSAADPASHVSRHDDGLSMVYALAATVDAKDHFTYGHSKKVSRYAVTIAEAMGLSAAQTAVLRDSGLLHDIGKISVPDAVLRKPGPLSEQEWTQMRGHPEVAAAILRHVEGLAACLPAILHHHERFDGSGYPLGLEGNNIPLEARIIAVADAYDAMTSDRTYRKALTPERAMDELILCAGRQFDSQVVHAFTQVMGSASPQLTRIHAEMVGA
ncbi:MAG: diguanylate cyclase, partial [Chloroflexota bacterium]